MSLLNDPYLYIYIYIHCHDVFVFLSRNVAAEEKRKKKRSDLEHQSRAAAHTKLYKSKRKTSGSK